MRSSLIITALAAAAQATMTDLEFKFISYVAEHGKSYTDKSEFDLRLSMFAKNDAVIDAFNADQNNSFVMGHNKFSDFTETEFKSMLGYRVPLVDTIPDMINDWKSLFTGDEKEEPVYAEFDENYPDWTVGVDWVTGGAVTNIKDQGTCGSCWAFSTVAGLEGAWARKSGELKSFSEQQLVDCVFNILGGCQGSTQEKGYDYYANEKYPHNEEDYEYKGRQGLCKYDENYANTDVKVKEYEKVRPLSEVKLQEALASQPVAVSIDATCIHLRFYKSGVFDHASCGTDLDHAVTAVGYGQLDGANFFNIKNSWGTGWGDEGYVKLAAKPGKGMLGVQIDPLFPVLH